MTGKDILDTAVKILARKDVDRVQLLFYINNAIKDPLRSKSIYRLQKSAAYTIADGIVSVPLLKTARLVRWSDGDGSIDLDKLPSVERAYETYTDTTETGTPAHYIFQGSDMVFYPIPDDGTTVDVVGEFWPAELTDSVNSTNVFSAECPFAAIYLGVAEYLDFLQEENRGGLWRQKGLQSIIQWQKENRMQEMTGVAAVVRDPLGSLGLNRRRQGKVVRDTATTETIIDDAGEW